MSALPAVVLAVLYAWGMRRSRRGWPAYRAALAAGGIAALAVALGPLDAAADRNLGDHMVQHVLIGAVAPALLAAAAPVRLAFAALPSAGRRGLARVLQARLMRVIAGPWVLVPLACVVLLGTHLPASMEAIERNGALHAGEHALLFWSALAAWIAVLGIDPMPGAPGPIGLLAALSLWMTVMATVGSQYASSDHVLIAAYAHRADIMAEQHSAGLIMWLGGMLTIVPVSLVGAMRGMWLEERRQRARERAEGVR